MTDDVLRKAAPARTSGRARALRRYVPRAIEAAATGAAKPTVNEIQPAMNPTAGWYILVR